MISTVITLTSAAGSGYAFLVTAKSVTGFGSPNTRRIHRPSLFGGFFVSGAWQALFGRAMRGASRLAGPGAGLPTRMVPPFSRFEARGGKNLRGSGKTTPLRHLSSGATL